MENEEKSDREGYLDFKLRVEQGDLALRLRAGQDWHNNPDNPQAPLAQYFDLFSAERHLDSMYHDRDRLDRLAREAENQLVKIRNDTRRQKTAEHVASRIEYWSVARFRDSCNFLEIHEWDVRARAKERQAAHPGETEGQSWFAAKKEAIDVHLDHVHVLENRARRDITRIIDAAVERDRRELAYEDACPDTQRNRTSRSERDSGRER